MGKKYQAEVRVTPQRDLISRLGDFLLAPLRPGCQHRRTGAELKQLALQIGGSHLLGQFGMG